MLDINAIIAAILSLGKLAGQFLAQVISNPIASIILGSVIAIAGRYVIYGVGLSLIAYGVIRIILALLGIYPL